MIKKRLLLIFLIGAVVFALLPPASYRIQAADTVHSGFSIYSWSSSTTFKKVSLSRDEYGVSKGSIKFLFDADQSWGDDISFKATDVTPNAYRSPK